MYVFITQMIQNDLYLRTGGANDFLSSTCYGL